jgi:YD repeat-containing protein
VTEFPHGYGAYSEYRTRYTYDVLDRLTQVQDALGNVTTLTYNGAGWKTSLTDPDMGAWSYRYDKAGRRVQQQDAQQQRTCTYYDRAGRVTGTQYLPTDCPASPPTPQHVALSYDSCANGVGQMCSQTMTYSVSHTITLTYDTLGRLN